MIHEIRGLDEKDGLMFRMWL